MRAISIAKFEKDIVNEDAAIAKENVVAVSDGAGGGGVFAECWSQYLVNNLPDKPITNYESFDKWIDGIWELSSLTRKRGNYNILLHDFLTSIIHHI